MLRLAIPVSIQDLGDETGFLVFLIIVGWISTVALASTEIVINIAAFSFMPAMGFLYAVQTLVSKNLGQKRIREAKATTEEATTLCLAMMGGLGILFMAIPGYILRLFTPDATIIQTAIPPLRLLGVVQFFDAIGMVYHGALRGAGDNTFLAAADLILMWVMLLPVTYFAGVYLDYGIMGAWFPLAIYIAGYALMAYLRFRYGPWSKIVF